MSSNFMCFVFAQTVSSEEGHYTRREWRVGEIQQASQEMLFSI